MQTDYEIPEYILQSVRALPALPEAVTRLLATTRDVNVPFSEIARIIETDPTLTARTLRAANSPLYRVSRRVKTVQQATVLLGRESIVNLALSISVMSMQSRLLKDLPVDATDFGLHSMAVAIAAREMARIYQVADAEEAFVAGLLHDIGKLIMVMHFGDRYVDLMHKAQHRFEPLDRLELQQFEVNHAVMGYALCQHWNLPPSLAQAVASHHDDEVVPDSVGDIVRRANDLAKIVGVGESGNRYVMLHAPYGETFPAWLRELILTLPARTHEIQGALDGQNTASTNGTANGERPVVLLEVPEPEERDLLTMTLLSMGYEPVEPNGHAADAPIARITVLDDSSASSSDAESVAIMDYGAWRAKRAVLGEDQIDMARLRRWIQKGIPTPVE